MQFSFDHKIFHLGPTGQTFVSLVTLAFKIFIFVLGIFLIFSEIIRLKAVGALFLIFSGFQFFTRKLTLCDLRYDKEEKINLLSHISAKTFWELVGIFRKTLLLKGENFYQSFLYLALKERGPRFILKRLGVDEKAFHQDLKKLIRRSKIASKELREIYLSQLKDSLEKAYFLAKKANFPNISLELIFIATFQTEDQDLNNLLMKYELNLNNLVSALLMENYASRAKRLSKFQQNLASFRINPTKKRLFNRSLTISPTPTLDKYGVDLTFLSRQGKIGILIGHEKEVEQILDILSKEVNNKVVLVGEEGSGKTSIVWHLAFRLDYEKVPESLLDYRMIEFDLDQFLGEASEMAKVILGNILDEIFLAQKIILVIPDLENIVKTERGREILTVFQSLFQSYIPLIVMTTPPGLASIETSFNIRENFEIVKVAPLSNEESLVLLSLKAILWEKEHKLIISPQAISKAIEIASQFIKTTVLPKSAESLILETISRCKRFKKGLITAEDILISAETLLNIPLRRPLAEEKVILTQLEELMHRRIVDQEEAIKEIARVLRIYRSGLMKKGGPIGTFLFVGPTGVGKTETAKVLSKLYFPDSEMLRLDMVEFQTAEDLEKLIGSKDGQIIGQLTEPLRQNPYRVILLDEFEKTHPTLMKIFLPIFDEGKVKDALSREIDFSHTIIIATSNAYSEDIKNWVNEGKSFEEIKNALRDKLTQIFSVELLNRFDNIIVYKPLGKEELHKIAQILIGDLKENLSSKMKFQLEISQAALEKIVELGTDPIFGARPLKRAIEQYINDSLARLILEEKIKPGSKVKVDYQEDKFIFKVE